MIVTVDDTAELVLSSDTITVTSNTTIDAYSLPVLSLIPLRVNVVARSKTFFSAVHGRSIEEVFVLLLTITHEGLEAPIRVCNDTRDLLDVGARGVISQGQEFIYIPFDVKLPNLEQDTIPTSKIIVDNIDRSMIVAIDAITTPPDVRMQIALSSDPDIIEYDLQGFVLNNISYDVLTIEADLTVEYFMSEPYPSVRFTPSRFPGLFRGRSTVQST